MQNFKIVSGRRFRFSERRNGPLAGSPAGWSGPAYNIVLVLSVSLRISSQKSCKLKICQNSSMFYINVRLRLYFQLNQNIILSFACRIFDVLYTRFLSFSVFVQDWAHKMGGNLKFARACPIFLLYEPCFFSFFSLDIVINPYNLKMLISFNRKVYKIPIYRWEYFEFKLKIRFAISTSEVFCSRNYNLYFTLENKYLLSVFARLWTMNT